MTQIDLSCFSCQEELTKENAEKYHGWYYCSDCYEQIMEDEAMAEEYDASGKRYQDQEYWDVGKNDFDEHHVP